MIERRIAPGPAEALRIVSAYALLGTVWILLSDEAAAAIFGREQWMRVSQLKGIGFVILTSALLYVLLGRAFASIRRSEQALVASRQQFLCFMDNLPAAAFLKDADGRFVYANSYWREIFSPDRDPVGLTSGDIYPSDQVANLFIEDDAGVLSSRIKTRRTMSVEVNGAQTEWLVTKFPVPLGPQGTLLVGGFAVDITEQRRLEDQIQQTARMEAVGRLAGGVAHDFNNMLTVINGYSELLEMSLQGTPQQAQVREIRATGERAAELTRQLLAFSRKQVLELKPTDVNEAIRGMERMLTSVLGKAIQLSLGLSTGLPRALVDRSKFEQAILNLVVNAKDAMSAGGQCRISTIRVTLTEPPSAMDPGFRPGDYVEVSIADTGEGMTDGVLSHLFEPFYTTKPKGKGTGLGLATVYGMVKQSGGAIAVDSAPGEGAMFRLYLPVVE